MIFPRPYRAALAAVVLACFGLPGAAFAYPVAQIKNNTEYNVSGTVYYAACRSDHYKVGPGRTWKATTNRGLCLITSITGRLSGRPASLRGTNKRSYGERLEVTTYKSTGTGYARFQVNAFGDRYRIFSLAEWAKASKTGQGKSPGFRFVNHTAWPIALSFDQVGCLYYGIVPAKFNGKPGEFRRDTGAVWFTIRAHIQPDGINPQTDFDCIKPVAELVGEVALAAMSGGASAAASAVRTGAKIAAKKIAKAALKKARKKALKKITSFGKKELGRLLTEASSITMPGQYAGYAWPFQCNKMPEYHITGGPVPVIDSEGNYYLKPGKPITVRKVNTCGNNMMPASPKWATAEKFDAARYFRSVTEEKPAQPSGNPDRGPRFADSRGPGARPAPATIPGGPYRGSCQRIQVAHGNLTATCRTPGSGWARSTLRNYRHCRQGIYNVNGYLRCGSPRVRPVRPAPAAIPGGQYRGSCQQIRVSHDSLTATCRTPRGGWVRSTLRNYRHCRQGIYNVNGHLRCGSPRVRPVRPAPAAIPGGQYRGSCQQIRVSRDSLTATCRTSRGGWVRSSLRNYRHCRQGIYNVNGHLRCGRPRVRPVRPAPAAIPGGSYRRTCQNISVSGGNLSARCRSARGGWVRSTLQNYRNCRKDIRNINGYLHCGARVLYRPRTRFEPTPAGSYRRSCRDIQAVRGNLTAVCRTRSGGWVRTSLRNYRQCRGYIDNINGYLRCGRR